MAKTTSGVLNPWPVLRPLEDWQATCTTVHMWTQIVGKIRLALAPPVNHWWAIPLYVTTRGLTTSPMPYEGRSLSIDFDFVSHRLIVATSEGDERSFELRPMSVAEFFRKTTSALRDLQATVSIFTRPVEVVDAIPFEKNARDATYDSGAINEFWRALVQADRVFNDFRSRFIGKTSPVHFFWGAFDLAVTRFSGRTAPRHQGGVPNCADWVMVEAYSHEVSSAGFWPGTGIGEASFYSYAYPAPAGFDRASIEPRGAYYHAELGEFVLPYETVRTATDPDGALLSFLQSTYEAAAELSSWDRRALERHAARQ